MTTLKQLREELDEGAFQKAVGIGAALALMHGANIASSATQAGHVQHQKDVTSKILKKSKTDPTMLNKIAAKLLVKKHTE